MKRYWNKFLNWLLPNRRERLLAEIMKRDQQLRLYDEWAKEQCKNFNTKEMNTKHIELKLIQLRDDVLANGSIKTADALEIRNTINETIDLVKKIGAN